MSKLLDAVKDADSATEDEWDNEALEKPKQERGKSKRLRNEARSPPKTEKSTMQAVGGELADSLLTNFLQSENDNYTIFSFVSGINNEVTNNRILASILRRRNINYLFIV